VIDRSAETSSTEGSPSVSAVVETMVEIRGDGERVRILGGLLADVEERSVAVEIDCTLVTPA
jgi:hypothetical protein